MANYNTTANVVLSVNGKQAQQMLSTLQREAQNLEKKIAKAATAGDKATMRKLQRELSNTNRMITQLQGSAATADQVLRRLDKASPKELNKTLKTLQSQLNGIQRGTAAWDAHVAKIKAVKTELQKVNATLATQQSRWDRMNMWLNNAQTFIMGLAAAITGLVMAGRKAVNAFAEMEEELANTRKYTGLTEQKVLELNEAFKKMDTRTSREKLNELAQEAGRLGKNALESVQGYVEAADIINVALVDLGDGATQTIAKLTNIFGVEELLGTKDAMLAVGSTVNVLSQNCTASKPYLVEFAQRMAGIGSQAGLTIPQILAFGAVLDANGQKVEMSATAIQKVIMNLANKNHEFAATLGMDAEKLNQTLKHSAKDGLLMFLEALQNMGKEVGFENATMILAPAFKEMGLDAARVSQVLSTLAMHLDEVKWQMGEADKAFREASSATKEYEIFNNTAQAAIDKAKKRVTELAIELGEKLYPIMKHIYTSSGIFLRVLNTIVSFLIEYRRVIVPLVAAIASYYATILMAKVAHVAWNAVLLSGKTIVSAFRYVVGLCDVAIIALTKGTKAAGTAITFLNQSMKASPWGLIISAVVALGVGIYNLTQKFKQQRAEEEKARKEMEEYKKSLTDLSEAAAQSAANEMSRVEALYKTAVDEAKSKDERRKAAERLQKLYPDYFKNLSTEEIMVGKAKTQYNNLRDAIIEVARARAAAAKIEENEKELLTLEQQAPALKRKMEADQRAHDAAVADWNRAREQENNIAYTNSTDAAAGGLVNVTPYANKVASTGETLNASRSAYNANITKQRQLNEANEYLRQKYNVSEAAIADAGGVGDVNIPDGGGGGGSTVVADRFAAEQQWREREEASARIAYATGKKDYLAYTAEMDRIAVEFYEKQLLHTDLSEDERLQITAKWREAQMKQQQHADAALLSQSVDAENDRYNAQMAEVKQFYIDGQISKETYDQRIEEYEILHQRNLSQLYKEGSKERLQAEQQLQSLLIAQMQRRQRETEENERKLASMKKEFFGDNPQERQAKYDADLALLQTVYDREIAAAGDNADEKLRIEEAFQQAKLALQKRYGLLAEEDERNRMQRAIADSVEWLNGDGGKAMQGAISTLTSGMGAIFSSLSSLIQAELEIETAAIEKRYDKEISAAEGNSYKVKKLEAQKEKEIAKAKNEANRKMFAMQVIQAVAQTAQNAISAYGSAAAIPVIGYILAPIAAGMAVAAGMIQIAAIKKQQQAAEAQGYSAGGFTPDGRSDEPVGIVHAGEWVASQKLVKSPKTRPIIEALEYAQRTNTIGSLAAADVSRSITAPMLLASQPQQSIQPNVIVNVPTQTSSNTKIEQTLDRLNERLNEPFVTVATVTGDKGINKAQDDYERLLRNKSPKTRK
jgi:TP901 family phage tail tape measure protein